MTDNTPVSQEDGRLALLAEILREDGHENTDAFRHACAVYFDGIDLHGATALEVGSGKGLIALYLALRGAARVLSLEPELAGSRHGTAAVQRERIDRLGLANVDLLPVDFNTWDPGDTKADLIVSHDSINHLHESSRPMLRHGPTYIAYLEIARKLHGLLKPDGVALVSDASRYGFFSMLAPFGVRRPWRWKKTSINWRLHQTPASWKRVFLDAGFWKVEVRYPLPYRLRWARGVVDTAIPNFFLSSSFILRAYA